MCYNRFMTTRKLESTNRKIGELFLNYRKSLTDLPKTREGFIENRSRIYFDYEPWISEKSLSNYETGKNIPSLAMLRKLAIAYEIDVMDLIRDLFKYL